MSHYYLCSKSKTYFIAVYFLSLFNEHTVGCDLIIAQHLKNYDLHLFLDEKKKQNKITLQQDHSVDIGIISTGVCVQLGQSDA